MIEMNYATALYESRNRIALAASRATLMSSLGRLEVAKPPAPFARRSFRQLTATVELKRGAATAEQPRAA
jgi:hypothetical protein